MKSKFLNIPILIFFNATIIVSACTSQSEKSDNDSTKVITELGKQDKEKTKPVEIASENIKLEKKWLMVWLEEKNGEKKQPHMIRKTAFLMVKK